MPITLYRVPGAVHYLLRRYKDACQPRARDHLANVLADLVEGFLARHATCISDAAGGPFGSVAVVPSSAGRQGRHPLSKVISLVPSLSTLNQVRLAASPTSRLLTHNQPVDGAFSAEPPPAPPAPAGSALGPSGRSDARLASPRRVLLLEDSYATGARAQSAASALSGTGFDVVAILAIGRAVDPRFAAHLRDYWETAASHPVNPTICCLEPPPGRP
ncbi:MAG: hypothetical protein ACYDH5_03350 [Acidimicrobiales bacterium]